MTNPFQSLFQPLPSQSSGALLPATSLGGGFLGGMSLPSSSGFKKSPWDEDRSYLPSLFDAAVEEERLKATWETSPEAASNGLLDVLALPEIALGDRMVRGILFAIANGEGISGVLKRAWEGSPVSGLIEMVTGIDAHHNVTGEDVLKAFGVEKPGFFGSMLFEIATGPSTWAGIGGVTHLGKAAKAGKLVKLNLGGDALEAAKDAFRIYERGTSTLAKASRAELEKVVGEYAVKAGKAGSWLESAIKDGIQDVTLTGLRREQAELGLRGSITMFGHDLLPRNISVPLFNGFARTWSRASRTFAGTGLGGATRDLFTNMPMTRKAAGLTAEELDKADKVDFALRRLTADMAHQYTGLSNVTRSRVTRFFMESWQHLDDDSRKAAMHLLEVGAIDDLQDLTGLSKRLDGHMDKVFGVGMAARVKGIDRLDRSAALGVLDEQVRAAGYYERGTEQALSAVASVSAEVADDYLPAAKLAYDDAFVERTSQVLGPDILRQGITRQEIKDLRKLFKDSGGELGITLDEAKVLDRWGRRSQGVAFEELARIDDALAPLTQMEDAAVGALRHGATGIENYGTRLRALFDANMATLERMQGKDEVLLSKAQVRKMRGSARKAAQVIGTTDDITERAAMLYEQTGERLGLLAQAAATGKLSQREALEAALYSADSLMKAWAEEEKAVGVLNHMIENYGAHVKTREGAKIINDLARNRFGASKVGREFFAKEREFTEWTVAEINALAHEQGFRATGDLSLNSWVRQELVAGDKNILERLEIVDPQAAEFFHADLAASLVRRADAHVNAMSAANFYGKFANTIEEGGFSSRIWNVTEANTDQVSRHMADYLATHPGHVIVQADDLFQLNPRRLREVMGESDVYMVNHTAFPEAMEYPGKFRPGERLTSKPDKHYFHMIDPDSELTPRPERIMNPEPNTGFIVEANDKGVAERVFYDRSMAAKLPQIQKQYPTAELVATDFVQRGPWGHVLAAMDDAQLEVHSIRQDILDKEKAWLTGKLAKSRSDLPDFDATEALRGVEGRPAGGPLINDSPVQWVTDPVTGQQTPTRRGRYIAVYRNVWNEMAAVHEKMSNPIHHGKLMATMHRATAFFKMWWTLPSPSFHIRNYLSDVHLAALDGMYNPRHLIDAGKIQRAIAGLGDDPDALARMVFHNVRGESVTAAELVKVAKRNAVIDDGVARAELLGRLEMDSTLAMSRKKAGVERFKSWWMGERNGLIKSFEAIGSSPASNVRLGHMLYRWREGDNLLDAAAATKRMLLDYDSHLLTHFERSSARLAIPFYTFLRRNLPVQVEHLLSNSGPLKLPVWEKAIRTWSETAGGQGAAELPPELVPDFVKDAYGVPVYTDKDGNPNYFLLKSWLPAGDVAEVYDVMKAIATGSNEERREALGKVAARVNPFAKIPIEITSNFSTYSGRDIERFDGQQVEVFGMGVDAKTGYLLRQIRVLNDLDRFGIVNMGAIANGELSPVSRSGERGERSSPGPLPTLLSFVAGGRLYPGNVNDLRRNADYEREAKIRELKAERGRLVRNVRTVDRKTQIEQIDEQLRELFGQRILTNRAKGQYERNRRTLG